MKSVRTLLVLVLFTAAAVWFTGCLLKPESNDSTSAPPSVVFSTDSSTTNWVNSASSAITFDATAASSPVTFSHYTHVSGASQQCTDCHNGASDSWDLVTAIPSVAIKASLRKKQLSMTDMYAGKFCGRCHTGAKAFDLRTNCSRCHADRSSSGPEVVFKNVNVLFSHKAHVDSFKKTCNECHYASGTYESPWAMKYEEGKYKMASMTNEFKGCGMCHRSGGVAFDCNTKASCKRCHTDSHVVVDAGLIATSACSPCHPQIVEEFGKLNSRNRRAHGKDWVGNRVSVAANSSQACTECHMHEAMDGRVEAFKVSLGNSHRITCQTCHFPNLSGDGSKYPYRLRKGMSDLCVTCHHSRYVYGDANREWPVAPTSGYPTLVPSLAGVNVSTAGITLTTATTSFPVEWYAAFLGGDASLLATTTANAAALARNASLSTNLGIFVKNTGVARYGRVHDGPQGDIFKGNVVRTVSTTAPMVLIKFTKDLNGASMIASYSDSAYHRTDEKGCVRCHMARDESNFVKANYGHTFQTSDDTCTEAGCHASFEDLETKKKTIEDKMVELGKRLNYDKSTNASGNVTLTWLDSNPPTDLKGVMNDTTIATGAKIILIGSFWNWFAIEEDNSDGMHNYQFTLNMLDNSITLIDQLAAKGFITTKWW